jgi:uncharacterized protein
MPSFSVDRYTFYISAAREKATPRANQYQSIVDTMVQLFLPHNFDFIRRSQLRGCAFSLSEESMNFRQIDQLPKTFVLVFQTGDELANGLSKFADEQKLSAASFKAVGALSSVRLAWFSWESKKYEPSVTLDEQVELLSLIGDVALNEGKPAIHAHAVIGKRDGTAYGGHLVEAHIRPTCEVVLTESPAHLQKFVDPESSLALIRL